MTCNEVRETLVTRLPKALNKSVLRSRASKMIQRININENL